MSKRVLSIALGILILVAAMGCGGGGEEKPAAGESATSAPVAAVDEATAATITGSVSFAGKAPKAKRISMRKDPKCVAMHKEEPAYTETVVINDNGTLRNVFVYVKDGLGNRRFPVPKDSVLLDQRGCTYHPHVFGIQAGQPLKIRNDDPTLHNIHAFPTKNQQFNIAQPFQNMTLVKRFDTPELMVRIKCDVHSWMSTYAGVLDHPYFDVTGEDGAFTIAKLPPGEYVIEAWHEKYETVTQTVTVGPSETKNIEFTFGAPAS